MIVLEFKIRGGMTSLSSHAIRAQLPDLFAHCLTSVGPSCEIMFIH